MRESFKTPYDQDDGITELQEAVLSLLEDAGIPTVTCDKVMAVIHEAEQGLSPCPEQVRRYGFDIARHFNNVHRSIGNCPYCSSK